MEENISVINWLINQSRPLQAKVLVSMWGELNTFAPAILKEMKPCLGNFPPIIPGIIYSHVDMEIYRMQSLSVHKFLELRST